jgi:hypothetical protein
MKGPFAEQRNKAIQQAISVYGIDTTGMKSIRYDQSINDNGRTNSKAEVRIGPAAFANGPGWLGAVIGHE